MSKVQVKTLELLISSMLRSADASSFKARLAFDAVFTHFSDEDFLKGTVHSSILTAIYLNDFYRYKSTDALSMTFHLDTKTLLLYRKNYIKLFAKKYLNLSNDSNIDLFFIYTALTDEINKNESQKNA